MKHEIMNIFKKFTVQKDYVVIDGSVIPSPDLRWCGPKFKADRYYLESAENEARRLVDHFGCKTGYKILDVGCGQGRLPIGLLRVLNDINYLGLDIDKKSVAWCNEHIGKEKNTYRFQHLNIYNERYNKKGRKLDEKFSFNLGDNEIDIIYLYSVFSHTTEQDMIIYLNEFHRILKKNGFIFFTTFAEENVPDVSYNPENYRLKCVNPLHVVRYNKNHIISIIEKCGFILHNFTYETETDGQSAFYLKKR